MRGNCGGPLSPKLRHAVERDGVVYIPASTWMKGYAAGDVGGEWSSCPVAQLHGLNWLVQIYARHKLQTLSIAEAFEDPTLLIVDAMTEFKAAENAVERCEFEAEERRRRLKSQAGVG